jgi:hypothetical protein
VTFSRFAERCELAQPIGEPAEYPFGVALAIDAVDTENTVTIARKHKISSITAFNPRADADLEGRAARGAARPSRLR